MSHGYPSMRPQPPGDHELSLPSGPYGMPDAMIHGLQNVKGGIVQSHPLEYSEKQWRTNLQQMDNAMLRNTQGLHAPLRLQMERQIANKMQRLGGMQSSNVMLDTLMGRDDIIDFTDILGNPCEPEIIGQPHMLMEKRQNIL